MDRLAPAELQLGGFAARDLRREALTLLGAQVDAHLEAERHDPFDDGCHDTG